MDNTHLTPSRCTKTDSEHGEQPGMSLAEVGEDAQQHAPNTEEENQNEHKNLPVGNPVAPQEAPIPPVWLRNRIVNFRCCWGEKKRNVLH